MPYEKSRRLGVEHQSNEQLSINTFMVRLDSFKNPKGQSICLIGTTLLLFYSSLGDVLRFTAPQTPPFSNARIESELHSLTRKDHSHNSSFFMNIRRDTFYIIQKNSKRLYCCNLAILSCD